MKNIKKKKVDQYNVLIGVAVPVSLKKKFKEICSFDGITVSQMVRSFIELSVDGGVADFAERIQKISTLLIQFNKAIQESVLAAAKKAKRKRSRRKN